MDEEYESSLRRNYRLAVDWSCDTCGGPTDMAGYTRPDEAAHTASTVTWDDIMHKVCRRDRSHASRPSRKCSRCGAEYDYGTLSCDPCDDVLVEVIRLERRLPAHRRGSKGWRAVMDGAGRLGYAECPGPCGGRHLVEAGTGDSTTCFACRAADAAGE